MSTGASRRAGGDAAPEQRPPERRPRRWHPGRLRPLAAGLAFTVLAAGTAVLADSQLGHPVRGLLGPGPERLSPAAPVQKGEGTYRFTRTQDDTADPVTFDPCRTLEVVYNPELEPPGSKAVVNEALAEVTRRTGLRLEVVGTTDERPSPDRPASDDARYGPGWSPVLLAWSTAEETPGLAGPVAGLGGSIAKAPGPFSQLTYVSGSVTLDAVDLGRTMRSSNGPEKVKAIVLHELAHLVGLDHVDETGELMHPENRDQTTFGPGDLAGLARLGTGRCRP